VPSRVTDAELAVLKELWKSGRVPIRRLADSLYPGGGVAHYATVQKLLDRLEAKGCVMREKDGRANLFSATARRRDLIRDQLQEAAEKLCDGSLTPLLTNLVSSAELSRQEIEDLRSLLDRLDDEKPETRQGSRSS
jgi:predicted transcriptional regulator